MDAHGKVKCGVRPTSHRTRTAYRLDDRGNMHLHKQHETWRGHRYDIRRRQIYIRKYNTAVFMTATVLSILSMFYKSCIQSVLTFSFICWFGNVSQKDKNKLQRVVNISSKITGLKQTSVTALYEKQILRKANKIINDSTHILYNEYVLQPSSRRFRTIISKTNRKRDSFMPMSVRLLNSKR